MATETFITLLTPVYASLAKTICIQIATAIALATATTIAIIFYKRLKTLQGKIESSDKMEDAKTDSTASHMATTFANDTKTVQLRLIKLMDEKAYFINKICRLQSKPSESPDKETLLSGLIQTFLEQISSEDTLKDIEISVDISHNGLISKFKQDLKKISDTDYKIALYFFIGLSADSISYITKYPHNYIYNRKYQIKKKIKESQSSYKDDLLKLI